MKKHKVGVFTFCNNNGPVNYGQILQGLAVQRILKEFDCESQIVLYQNLKIPEFMTKRVQRFQEFVAQNIKTTQPCFSREEINEVVEECDILLCGSDQVWLPDTIDDVWTLNVGKKDIKRVSLAASGIFYDDEFTNERIACYKNNFENIDFISVRESSAIPILSKYTSRDITVCPDPTLFVDKTVWDSLAAGDNLDEEYVFCYCLGGNKSYDLLLKKISGLYGNVKIKYIASNLVEDYCYKNMEPVYDAGPSEFIRLLKGSKAVVTDSFHGVTMSIVFGKDWYNIDRFSTGKDRFG